MSFINHVVHSEKVLATKPACNIIAITLCTLIIITPVLTLYVLLGDMFWRILLLIGCCFIISPFFAIYGFARAATPVSPNQLLSMLIYFRRKETVKVDKTKILKRMTAVDVIKGVLFSFILVILYKFFTWLYGSLFFLGYFLYVVGPVVQLIMKSA